MVEILCFKYEFPEVSIYAKAEYANPGGSLKDRPCRRMLLEALITGKIGKGRLSSTRAQGMPESRTRCSAP
jgi:cysteine synthase